jgi:hypothetical protein
VVTLFTNRVSPLRLDNIFGDMFLRLAQRIIWTLIVLSSLTNCTSSKASLYKCNCLPTTFLFLSAGGDSVVDHVDRALNVTHHLLHIVSLCYFKGWACCLRSLKAVQRPNMGPALRVIDCQNYCELLFKFSFVSPYNGGFFFLRRSYFFGSIAVFVGSIL